MREVSEKIDRFDYVLPDSHFDTERLKKDFRQALEEAYKKGVEDERRARNEKFIKREICQCGHGKAFHNRTISGKVSKCNSRWCRCKCYTSNF